MLLYKSFYASRNVSLVQMLDSYGNVLHYPRSQQYPDTIHVAFKKEIMKKYFVKCLLVAMLAILGAGQVVCAKQKPLELPETLVPEWTISSYISATGEVDFEDSAASYSKNRFQITADYLDINFSYSREDYSWNNTGDLNFGTDRTREPWDSLEQLALRYTTGTKLGERGLLNYGAQVASSFEETIDADSLSGNVFVNYGYYFSKSLLVTVGVAGGVNAVEWTVLPLVGLQYVSGPYEFQFGFPKSYARYAMSKELAFTAAVGVNYDVYSLSDTSPIISDGFVQITEGKCSLVADWYPTEYFHLTLGPEVTFARSMQFYDGSGDKVWGTQDSDPALGLRAGVTLEF